MARKKKEKAPRVALDGDALNNIADVIAGTINQQFSKSLGTVAYTDNVDDIVGWIPTGCDILDLAISNRRNGGLPLGRIAEVSGLEGSGKSLLCAHVCAQVQRMGGLAIYFDTEYAFSKEFFEALGVDTSNNWVYIQMNTLETIFNVVESAIAKAREISSDMPIVIVIDSIMGATTNVENATDYEKDGWATSKALVLSKAMRKITGLVSNENVLLLLVNQLRVKMGVVFGDNYTTSGGKAIPYHASVRIRLQLAGQIKLKTSGPDKIVGVKAKAKIFKNRVGPPGRTVSFDIYFDRGIDNYGSWLTALKEYNIIKQSGSWYRYDFINKETGEIREIKFQSKDFESVVNESEELRNALYDEICEKYIMEYKKFEIDDVEVVDNTDIEVQ